MLTNIEINQKNELLSSLASLGSGTDINIDAIKASLEACSTSTANNDEKSKLEVQENDNIMPPTPPASPRVRGLEEDELERCRARELEMQVIRLHDLYSIGII
jgi:hypothetical protein